MRENEKKREGERKERREREREPNEREKLKCLIKKGRKKVGVCVDGCSRQTEKE